jgi:hypothetical protein
MALIYRRTNMPLKPHMKDPNRDKAMRRFKEDPASFGIGGARTEAQRKAEKELAEKQEAEMLAKEEARIAEEAEKAKAKGKK